jgi:predicted amino acid-binding ACT domain protein
VIEETMLMLDEGSPAVKQRMITNLFTKMMGVLTEESSEDMSVLREQLAIMVSEMSVLPESAEEEQPDPESDEPE